MPNTFAGADFAPAWDRRNAYVIAFVKSSLGEYQDVESYLLVLNQLFFYGCIRCYRNSHDLYGLCKMFMASNRSSRNRNDFNGNGMICIEA